MASARVTRACSQAQQSIVERCYAGASKKVKEAALVAVQQLPVHHVARLDSLETSARVLHYLVARLEDRALCKLLVEHNKELAGTELVYAAACGKEEHVWQLLAEGVPVDSRDKAGRTPLLAVVTKQVLELSPRPHLPVARVLLEAGASMEAALLGGGTVLQESLYRRDFALAHLLLDAGASTVPHPSQRTLLHALVYAAQDQFPRSSPGDEGWEIVGLARRLVAAGVPVNGLPASAWTPLMLAVNNVAYRGLHCEELLAFIEALLDLGADPRLQPDGGVGVLPRMASMLVQCRQPLHIANFRRLLQRLVAAGAGINARGEAGFTVLGIMCQAAVNPALGPPEQLLRALVEAGADLQAEQPVPLPHAVLTADPKGNTPSVLRALAAFGYPMDAQFDGLTALQFWVEHMADSAGMWPHNQPPSPFQLACLEALVDTGSPLVTSPHGSAEHGGGSNIIRTAGHWLSLGVGTWSMEVVQALLWACPEAAMSRSQHSDATALEMATEDLWSDLAWIPVEEGQQPLEGLLGERVLWYCTVAPLLLAAGSPPAANKYLDLSVLPSSWQEQLRFLPLVASGSSWSPERHHLYPPAFCTAARQLLLIHECCGFGASQPSDGQARRAGGCKRRAGSRRSSKPARTMGIQLPQGVLHHILELASQPLLGWVPQLAAEW